MNTQIVRQPILNKNKEVFAYEILWRDTSAHRGQEDIAAANTIEDFFYELNNQRFLDGKTTFITITPNLLIKNIPRMFASDKLVIQIDDSVIIHPLAKKVLYRFKRQGYRIAVKGFDFAPRFFEILEVVDYVKIDFGDIKNPSLKNIVNIGSSLNKDIVAYNVNTPAAYELASSLPCAYIQGASVAEQVTSKIRRRDHIQGNFFQLMVAITKDEPDMDEITEIISRDVTLVLSLLRLVNSAYFALPNRVRDVKPALVTLGLAQLKEWVYLLSFKDTNNDYPEELLRMSFLRARFCSQLAPYVKGLPITANEAYLMGMFSTLEALMEAPLAEALSELSLSGEVKTALLTEEGICGTLYKLIKSYENADWRKLATYAEKLGISQNVISQQYFECVEYVNNVWKEITNPNATLPADEE